MQCPAAQCRREWGKEFNQSTGPVGAEHLRARKTEA